jgi:hypothetical protein
MRSNPLLDNRMLPAVAKMYLARNLNLVAAASAAPAAAATTTFPAALSATASAVASTASAMLSLRPRLIHIQSAATDLRAIQCGDGLVSIFIAGHFHKTESARAPGIAVGHDADPVHLPEWLKHLSQFVFRRVEA